MCPFYAPHLAYFLQAVAVTLAVFSVMFELNSIVGLKNKRVDMYRVTGLNLKKLHTGTPPSENRTHSHSGSGVNSSIMLVSQAQIR